MMALVQNIPEHAPMVEFPAQELEK